MYLLNLGEGSGDSEPWELLLPPKLLIIEEPDICLRRLLLKGNKKGQITLSHQTLIREKLTRDSSNWQTDPRPFAVDWDCNTSC